VEVEVVVEIMVPEVEQVVIELAVHFQFVEHQFQLQ
jgi:hypothetical protein